MKATARAILLWASMVVLALPAVSQAQDYIYTANGDGTCTITGYTGSGGDISIPGAINGLTVTGIIGQNSQQSTFSSCTSITIPTSVTSIGDFAFFECTSLTNIVIPNSVTSIGLCAFYWCVFTSVTIPDSVTSIGDCAFNQCPALANVTIGTGLTSIGTFVFAGCVALTSVTIPNNVTSIGSSAFNICPALTNVTIGTGVTSIGFRAFGDCAMASVTIPASVTSIGNYAFSLCFSMTGITVSASNPAYSSVGGVLFDKYQTTLIQYPGHLTGSYTITNSVTSIGAGAFWDCALNSITIPSSVTSIGEWAIRDCTSLTNIFFQGNAPSLGSDVFANDHATVYYLPGTTGWGSTYGGLPTVPVGYAYMTNSGTATITAYTGSVGVVSIPAAIAGLPVTSIGDYSFRSCTGVTEIAISGNVTNIGVGAFQDCTSLSSVTIPASVTSLGTGVVGLSRVRFSANATSLGTGVFSGCTNLNGVYFKGNAPIVGADVFEGAGNVIVYYLPGTTNWASTLGGRPTVLWNPRVQPDATFGVQAHCFGFTFTNAGSPTVIVTACTNLTNPTWITVSTNTLPSGSSYFSDPQWTNYPNRFYRFQMP